MKSTLRITEMQFTLERGDWLSRAHEEAERYGALNGLEIFASKVVRHEGGLPKKVIVTYTNPEIPWLSAEEPLDITVGADMGTGKRDYALEQLAPHLGGISDEDAKAVRRILDQTLITAAVQP